MDSFHEEIAELLTLGKEVFQDLSTCPTIPRNVERELARRWLFEHARNVERKTARAVERQATRGITAETIVLEEVNRAVTRIVENEETIWPELFGHTFPLPNGEDVTWEDATISQHELRISQLEQNAAGNLQTAALHRRAVNVILDAHVATLGEAVGA